MLWGFQHVCVAKKILANDKKANMEIIWKNSAYNILYQSSHMTEYISCFEFLY